MTMRTIPIVYFLTACVICTSCRSAERPQATSKPDCFPIMNWDGLRDGWATWDDPHSGIASLKEANYTIAAFIRPEQIALCEKLGMKAFLRPAGHPIKWRELSDEKIEAAVKEMVDESRGSDAVVGFFIMDE